MAPITPWLLDCTRKWDLDGKISSKEYTANSTANISSNPIGNDWPGRSFQAAHLLLSKRPIPHEEEASTKMVHANAAGGCRIGHTIEVA